MERLFRGVIYEESPKAWIEDVPVHNLDFLLENKTARLLAKTHAKFQARLRDLLRAPRSHARTSSVFKSSYEKRITALQQPMLSGPKRQAYRKLTWRKATKAYLDEIAETLQREEATLKQDQAPTPQTAGHNQRLDTAIVVQDRHLARSKWLAEQEAKIDPTITEVNTVLASDTQVITTPLTKLKVDIDGSGMANRMRRRRRGSLRFIHRPYWIRLRSDIVRRRTLTRLRKVMILVPVRASANIKYYTRRDSKGDSKEADKERTDVMSPSTHAITRPRRQRKARRGKNDEDAAVAARGHPRRAAFAMHRRARMARRLRLKFILHTFAYRRSRKRLARTYGLSTETGYRLRHHEYLESRNRMLQSRGRFIVKRERESLWNTMKSSTERESSSPATRQCHQSQDDTQRLVEEVQGFLRGDTSDGEMLDEHSEGVYKPFKG